MNISINYGDNEKVIEYIKYDENGNIVDRKSFFTGEWILYYKNKQLKYKGNYKDGEPVGEWVTYYENGKIKEKRNYSNEEWTSYYENGKIHESGKIRGDRKHLNNTTAYDTGMLTRNNDGIDCVNGKFLITEYGLNFTYMKSEFLKSTEKFLLDRDAWFSGETKQSYGSVEDIQDVENYLDIREGQRDAEWVSYYENGDISEKGNFSDGEWISYFENGEVLEKGKYEGGKRVGEWMGFFVGKKIRYKSNYSSSEFVLYNSNGQIENIKYADGKWVFYHSGNVWITGKYETGKPTGEWIWFDVGLGEGTGKCNFATGEYIRYYEGGKIQLKINLSTEELIAYSKEGQILKKENHNTGEEITYRNGQIYEKGYYKNGKKVGVWTVCKKKGGSINCIDTNGKLIPGKDSAKEDVYSPDNKEFPTNGEWVSYDENGNIRESGYFKNDKREGEWISYYEKDKISEKKYFKNGNLNGEYTTYYNNGQLMERKYYINDELDCKVQ